MATNEIIIPTLKKIVIKKNADKIYFRQILGQILLECYDITSLIMDKQIGIKSANQPFELLVENILIKYCQKYDKISYIKHPNGSQKPPDFQLSIDKFRPINLECKSARGLRPVWNCSLPSQDTIYVFYTHKLCRTFIFEYYHIISDMEIEKLQSLHKFIRKICDEYKEGKNNTKNFSYYPRQMYNQINSFDIINRDKFLRDTLNNINRKNRL